MHQHPTVASAISAPQARGMVRLPTVAEQALMDEIARLEGLALLNERMCATIDADHGRSVRKNLSAEEVAAFTNIWSEDVLDLCLRAGTTSVEVRRALRTGELPDHGLISSLAAFRSAIPDPARSPSP